MLKLDLSKLEKYDEWETPSNILKNACYEYKIYPTLDVCATFQNKKCLNYIDTELNAFFQGWDEDFFMNPPYSEIGKWIKRAYFQTQTHNVQAIILTFAKTDTYWWHQYVEQKAEVHFIRGRIKFLKLGTRSKNSAPYPSCWIIYPHGVDI